MPSERRGFGNTTYWFLGSNLNPLSRGQKGTTKPYATTFVHNIPHSWTSPICWLSQSIGPKRAARDAKAVSLALQDQPFTGGRKEKGVITAHLPTPKQSLLLVSPSERKTQTLVLEMRFVWGSKRHTSETLPDKRSRAVWNQCLKMIAPATP